MVSQTNCEPVVLPSRLTLFLSVQRRFPSAWERRVRWAGAASIPLGSVSAEATAMVRTAQCLFLVHPSVPELELHTSRTAMAERPTML